MAGAANCTSFQIVNCGKAAKLICSHYLLDHTAGRPLRGLLKSLIIFFYSGFKFGLFCRKRRIHELFWHISDAGKSVSTCIFTIQLALASFEPLLIRNRL